VSRQFGTDNPVLKAKKWAFYTAIDQMRHDEVLDVMIKCKIEVKQWCDLTADELDTLTTYLTEEKEREVS
jgi:hypothetical protein